MGAVIGVWELCVRRGGVFCLGFCVDARPCNEAEEVCCVVDCREYTFLMQVPRPPPPSPLDPLLSQISPAVALVAFGIVLMIVSRRYRVPFHT